MSAAMIAEIIALVAAGLAICAAYCLGRADGIRDTRERFMAAWKERQQ